MNVVRPVVTKESSYAKKNHHIIIWYRNVEQFVTQESVVAVLFLLIFSSYFHLVINLRLRKFHIIYYC